jgi:hypothetical protein
MSAAAEVLPLAPVPAPARSEERAHDRRQFLWALGLATALPMLLMPLLARVLPQSAGIESVRNTLVFLGGNGHVALTAFFYSDRRVREFFATRPFRYYVAPALLVIGTGLFFVQWGQRFGGSLLLAYFTWQTYHYMRQNYGILAFVGAGTVAGRPGWLERVTLNLGVAAGILALPRLMGLAAGTPLEGRAGLLYEAGLYTLGCVPVAAAASLWANPKLLKDPVRLAFFAATAFFYAPSFLFDDLPSAVLSYAFAHGFQYFVFMVYVASQDGSPSPAPRVALLAVLAFSIGALLTAFADRPAWGEFAFGAYLGVVMAHFVVDAGMWRLGESFQRDYLRRAFACVLAR